MCSSIFDQSMNLQSLFNIFFFNFGIDFYNNICVFVVNLNVSMMTISIAIFQ